MRIALADDAALFREALASALASAGFEIVGQAADAPGAVELVRSFEPALIVLDVRMPPTRTTEGLQAAATIRAAWPSVGLLILSQDVETRHVLRLLRDTPKGVGYLLKDRVGNLAEFVEAIRRVGSGGSVVDPEVVSTLLGRGRAPGPLDELTPRERQVLELMAEGRSNLAIAERLGLTERTVESNVRVVMSKLGLEPAVEDHRRVLAVLTYLRSG
ncbi:MAG TPA: response regulator transcription factor [Candidatus Limnocylindrales bacterium]|nr:response regulator transcription factor [Candidatus Limnocylindrales bacterium]